MCLALIHPLRLLSDSRIVSLISGCETSAIVRHYPQFSSLFLWPRIGRGFHAVWNAKRSFSEFGHKCAHNAQTVHLPSPRKINAHLNGGMKAYHFDETALNTRLALSERVIYLVFSDRILSSVVITQLKLDPSNRLRLISTRTPQP